VYNHRKTFITGYTSPRLASQHFILPPPVYYVALRSCTSKKPARLTCCGGESGDNLSAKCCGSGDTSVVCGSRSIRPGPRIFSGDFRCCLHRSESNFQITVLLWRRRGHISNRHRCAGQRSSTSLHSFRHYVPPLLWKTTTAAVKSIHAAN
jgi:hypothetical protein